MTIASLEGGRREGERWVGGGNRTINVFEQNKSLHISSKAIIKVILWWKVIRDCIMYLKTGN